MIILTYKPKLSNPLSGAPNHNHNHVPFIVERFNDDMEEGAHNRAILVARDGASEVYLSRAYEQYWLAPTVERRPVE